MHRAKELGTQDTLELMKLHKHWIRSATEENDQNSRHGNHIKNRYNVPLNLYVPLFEGRLDPEAISLLSWGLKE